VSSSHEQTFSIFPSLAYDWSLNGFNLSPWRLFPDRDDRKEASLPFLHLSVTKFLRDAGHMSPNTITLLFIYDDTVHGLWERFFVSRPAGVDLVIGSCVYFRLDDDTAPRGR
jgi:hypothetical protein